MRLKDSQIEKITSLIMEMLKNCSHAKIRGSEGEVRDTLTDAIRGNMREEQLLESEAKKIMESYSRQIAGGDVDERKVFTMIKAKLAKEKGFVL